MNTNYSENNHLILVGKVVSEKTYSHEIYGEKFYLFNLEVVRLSSTTDIIPITISERLLTDIDLSIGKGLEIEGQFRSYNNYENEKNRLVLTVFAKEIKEVEINDDDKETVTNEVELIGYICKKPIYRQTEVKLIGRVQSRTYEKKYEDGTSETRVAYEVSVASMEVVTGQEEENEEVKENENV